MKTDDKKKLEVLEQVIEILNCNLPVLNKAMNYVENEAREIPIQAFIEGRDVLHHLHDLVNNMEDDKAVEKNLTEMKQHFRRGIVESYQTIYDRKRNYLDGLYQKYCNAFKQYEKLFFLDKTNQSIHEKVNNRLNQSGKLWIKGRNLKNNDYDNPKFQQSIDCFKKAFDLLDGLEPEIDSLWSTFNKRFYLSGVSIFCFLFVVALLIF